MEQQIIDRILDPANNIVPIIGDRLFPNQKDNAVTEPSIAYIFEGEVKERCVKGSHLTGTFTAIIEARTKNQVIELRNLLIEAFDNYKVFRLSTFTDDFERTVKGHMAMVVFDIIRIKKSEL